LAARLLSDQTNERVYRFVRPKWSRDWQQDAAK